MTDVVRAYAGEKFDRAVAGRCIRIVSMQPRYPAPLRFVVRLVSPDPFSVIGGRVFSSGIVANRRQT